MGFILCQNDKITFTSDMLAAAGKTFRKLVIESLVGLKFCSIDNLNNKLVCLSFEFLISI